MGEYTDFSEALCLLKLIWQYPDEIIKVVTNFIHLLVSFLFSCDV